MKGIKNATPLIYFIDIFILAPDHHGYVVTNRCPEVNFIPDIACDSGISVLGVSCISCYIVKHEQGAIRAFAPIVWQHHGYFVMLVGSRGGEEAVLAYQIFCFDIACEFQRSVRVLFAVNRPSDSDHPKLFISKGVIFETAIVIVGIH